VTAIFNAATVSAHTKDGSRIPLHALFIVNLTDVGGSMLGGTNMRGWTVFIGDEKFECFGAMGRMAMVVEKGGVRVSSSLTPV
jgi:hypothetical protein